MAVRAKDVCAVVPTFHPDSALPARIESILLQAARVVIVDDRSTDVELQRLRPLTSNPRIGLLCNRENLGLARALNIGIRHAAAWGFNYVLLLDQDSHIEPDMLETLLGIFNAYPRRERLALIGSHFREKHRHKHSAEDESAHAPPWKEVKWSITSGSLLPVAAFRAIGPFREDFFIDHVDTEYCMRARAKGYEVLQSRRPLMTHSIGSPTRHRLLWMNKWTSNHSADRRYYMARNYTVLLKEFGNLALGMWAVKGLMASLRQCKRVFLYEKAKRGKIRAALRGWWDGVRGHMGPRKRQYG